MRCKACNSEMEYKKKRPISDEVDMAGVDEMEDLCHRCLGSVKDSMGYGSVLDDDDEVNLEDLL